MKRRSIALCLCLLIFPAQTLAANWQEPGTPVNKPTCDGLARACGGAVRELLAARELLKARQEQVAALESRLDTARKEITALKEISALSQEQITKLEAVIAALSDAKAALEKIRDEQARYVEALEKKLARSRKVARISLLVNAIAVTAVILGVTR